MSKIKTFASMVATLIYSEKLNNDAASIKLREIYPGMTVMVANRSIRVVRSNPNIFKDLANQ